MVVISTREFMQSRQKYFDMALSHPIYLKRRKRLFEIRSIDDDVVDADDNPSPSGDPYFADPKNLAGVIADVRQAQQEIREGKYVEYTPELKQKWFGDV